MSVNNLNLYTYVYICEFGNILIGVLDRRWKQRMALWVAIVLE